MKKGQTGRRVCTGWLLLGSLLVAGPGVAAEPPPATPALVRLADQLVENLQQQAGEAGLGSLLLIIKGDGTSVPIACRLQQDFQQLLLQRLNASLFVERARAWRAAPGAAGNETLQCRLERCSWVLRLRLMLHRQDLVASGDLVPARASLWRRLLEDKATNRQPRHLFARVEADAEVRLGVGLPPAATAAVAWRMREVVRLPVRVLDLGSGPVDDRPGDEVVTLEPTQVRAWHFRNGTLLQLASYSFARLPDNPLRSRRIAGHLLVVDFNDDGRAEIFYRVNNKRQGELLAYTGARLVSWRRFDGVPLCLTRKAGRPQLLLGRYRPGTDRLYGEFQRVDINAVAGPRTNLGGDGYRLRCWREREGLRLAWLDVGGGLHLLDGHGQQIEQRSGVGMAFTWLRPWSPERLLLHSLAVRPPQLDRLQAALQQQPLWQSREVTWQLVAMTAARCPEDGREECLWVAGWDSGGGTRLLLLEPE